MLSFLLAAWFENPNYYPCSLGTKMEKSEGDKGESKGSNLSVRLSHGSLVLSLRVYCAIFDFLCRFRANHDLRSPFIFANKLKKLLGHREIEIGDNGCN